MDGIIVINKPEGFTSFDVIAKLRKKLGQKKIGHMGTLDPIATGVLPILLGETAKFQQFVNNNQKRYLATIQFGIETDTLDITGKILNKSEKNITKKELEKVTESFCGQINQIPPMFSAIKMNGQKLYDLARKGIEVDRESRQVFIDEIKIIEFNEAERTAILDIKCSKGTYIRTLCDDIGQKLGCGATVTKLHRTLSNGFDISQSITLETLLNSDTEAIKLKYILPTETLFGENMAVNITPNQAKRFLNGGELSLERMTATWKNGEIYKVICNNVFVGVGIADLNKNSLKIGKCLHSKF